jgi:hypothetical protein
VPTFLNDTFTGTNGALLTARPGEIGATWTLHPLFTGAPVLFNDGLRNGSANSVAYASGVPASADYAVSATVRPVSLINTAGVVGRLNTAADTCYHARYGSADGAWQIFKFVAGVATKLGEYVSTAVVGTNYDLRLEMRGTSIKLYLDGVERVSATDSAITAAGRAGVRFTGIASDTTHLHLDDVSATDSLPVGTSRVVVYGMGGIVGTSRVLPYGMGGIVGTSRALLYTLSPPPAPIIRVTKPSLGLSAEIRTPEGAGMTWDSHARAEERPRAISFSTRRGEGFGNASLTLSRRVDREYVDLGLLDELVLYGEDGSTAFEGRLASSPRSLSDTHTIAPQFVGWMAHARDRKATQIYVDRDVSAWVGMTVGRRAGYVGSGTNVTAPEINGAAVTTGLELGRSSTAAHTSEAWYDAGPGARIRKLYFSAAPQAAFGANVVSACSWSAFLADSHISPAATVSATNPSGVVAVVANGAYRYAGFNLYRPSDKIDLVEVRWSTVAVYGDHGLPLIGAEPAGVAASDVIAHAITKWCPMLNPGGVKRTTTPIPHLAFKERVDPYDIMLEANKFHLWNLAVWEVRTVHYEPVDLTDYDWEVRLSDHGVGLDLQGDSTEEAVYNGIAVSFENVATAGSEDGTRDSVTPDRYSELRDLSPDNPANRHGYERWAELELSSPSTLQGALFIGQAKLAELNSPRSPGSITVKGHIRDRAGNWQPVWRVRAGQTVAITDHPNTRPRLIVETNYEHDSHTLTIGVDSLIPRVEAILDRLSAAQVAVGTLS